MILYKVIEQLSLAVKWCVIIYISFYCLRELLHDSRSFIIDMKRKKFEAMKEMADDIIKGLKGLYDYATEEIEEKKEK